MTSTRPLTPSGSATAVAPRPPSLHDRCRCASHPSEVSEEGIEEFTPRLRGETTAAYHAAARMFQCFCFSGVTMGCVWKEGQRLIVCPGLEPFMSTSRQ